MVFLFNQRHIDCIRYARQASFDTYYDLLFFKKLLSQYREEVGNCLKHL